MLREISQWQKKVYMVWFHWYEVPRKRKKNNSSWGNDSVGKSSCYTHTVHVFTSLAMNRVRPCDFTAVNSRAGQLLRLVVRQPSSSSVRNTISRDCVESNRPGCPTLSSSLETRPSPYTCVHTPYTHTHATYKGSRFVFSRDLDETGMGSYYLTGVEVKIIL